jgi:hypothetical protein
MSLNGFNTLLVGSTGTGKTYSLRTLIDAGITPFVLFTEPGMTTLGDLKCDKLHWKYVAPASPTWDMMIDSATKINTMSLEGLAKLGGINKQGYGQFRDVLATLANFKCDRCGECFGDVTTWGPDRALIVDSLSGLNIMAMDLVVGSKPVKAMSDWMISMDNLERLVNKLCADTKCHFILTAHLERETDEVTGGVQLMASTLGKKLAPRLPRFFDDVVMCKREGAQFFWSTAAVNADLKSRNLPIADKLEPTFRSIADGWVRAGGILQPAAVEEVNQSEKNTSVSS